MGDPSEGDRGYTVITQTQTVAKLPDDTYGPVVRVTFRVTNGPVLSIDVPADRYTVDNVRAAIEERVTHAAEIQNL